MFGAGAAFERRAGGDVDDPPAVGGAREAQHGGAAAQVAGGEIHLDLALEQLDRGVADRRIGKAAHQGLWFRGSRRRAGRHLRPYRKPCAGPAWKTCSPAMT